MVLATLCSGCGPRVVLCRARDVHVQDQILALAYFPSMPTGIAPEGIRIVMRLGHTPHSLLAGRSPAGVGDGAQYVFQLHPVDKAPLYLRSYLKDGRIVPLGPVSITGSFTLVELTSSVAGIQATQYAVPLPLGGYSPKHITMFGLVAGIACYRLARRAPVCRRDVLFTIVLGGCAASLNAGWYGGILAIRSDWYCGGWTGFLLLYVAAAVVTGAIACMLPPSTDARFLSVMKVAFAILAWDTALWYLVCLATGAL